MAFKTLAYRIEERRLSAEDLRRAFDSALCEIHQADLAAKKGLQRRIPIVQRAKRFGISQADAEKRALSEAARALAELWKV
ncbi:MAG: hypothetical protein WAL89_14775 [Candidatus Sulfotelmatobacter sp.]|jgi:hypothetical protein